MFSSRIRRRIITFAAFSLVALATIIPATASASANGCSGPSCVSVTGSGLRVEKVSGVFNTCQYNWDGVYRTHVWGTKKTGASYSVYSSPRTLLRALNCNTWFTLGTWYPNVDFRNGSTMCAATQRRNSNGSYSNLDIACVGIKG